MSEVYEGNPALGGLIVGSVLGWLISGPVGLFMGALLGAAIANRIANLE